MCCFSASGTHRNASGCSVFPGGLTLFFLVAVLGVLSTLNGFAEDGYALWLRYVKVSDQALLQDYRRVARQIVTQETSPTMKASVEELQRGLEGMLGETVPVSGSLAASAIRPGAIVLGTPENNPIINKLDWSAELKPLGTDGFVIRSAKVSGKPVTVIASQNDIGVLYGTFHFLRLIQTQKPLGKLAIVEKPKIQIRMLTHWDNADRSIERGYAGKSLWRWDQLPDTLDPRYKDYARACASLGINAATLNNVNTSKLWLESAQLKKIAALADVFRPYGIKVFLCPLFSAPKVMGGLPTCDPLDPAVRQWWKDKADEIYSLIPDFGGFQVKANSEGMPGPLDYKRTHAEGASALANAVAPHGGIVSWRAFVYSGNVASRPKNAYDTFAPLDGKFGSNVMLQIKNGPMDFQPREPFSPLFGAMPKTQLMAELQITQEYLGFSQHLVYLGELWEEFFSADTFCKGPGSTVGKVIDGTLFKPQLTGVTGVANTGADQNWCGHHFAQANWYAFGRMTWNHTLSAEAIADEWIRATWSNDPKVIKTIKSVMLGSRDAFVNYDAPMGLSLHCQTFHYAPCPELRRAFSGITADGLGIDRSSRGCNAVAQYFSPLREQFDDPTKVDERLLLWFHHVPWDFKMRSGATFWEEFCNRFTTGAKHAAVMQETWRTLKDKIDEERFQAVDQRLSIQTKEAAEWRDYVLRFYHNYSKRPLPSDIPVEGSTGPSR